METIIEDAVIETERLLIYQNEPEISRITNEAESRARLLNNILGSGLVTNESLKQINSPQQIDDFIFQEQLKVNKPLFTQHKAGKKNLIGEYALPENLQVLKDALIAWITYPFSNRPGNKFNLIIFTDHWALETLSIEREFIMRNFKIYVDGDQITELKTLLAFGEYLATECVSGQLFASKFLSDRYTCDSLQACNSLPKAKYMVKYSYFRQDRSN